MWQSLVAHCNEASVAMRLVICGESHLVALLQRHRLGILQEASTNLWSLQATLKCSQVDCEFYCPSEKDPYRCVTCIC